MSALGERYEELEDRILQAAPEDGRDGFTIDNLEKAEWAVRKIARARRHLAEAKELAHAEQSRIVEWLADEEHRYQQSVEFLEELLARYHRHVLDDDPKAKTIRLPGGELVARKAPDSLLIDESDERIDDTYAWLEANEPAAIVTRRSIDKPTLKRKLVASDKPESGGFLAMDPVTGEVVPGVLFRLGETAFRVKTDGDQ